MEQRERLTFRYSSISLYIKNSELYKRIYVLGESFPSSPAQVIGQALHKKLLEEDLFFTEFIVGAETKHQFQTRFCELVAKHFKNEDEVQFDTIPIIDYVDFCVKAGYARSSAVSKWKELIVDKGIQDMILFLHKEYRYGTKLTPISQTDYDLVCSIVNKIKEDKFIILNKNCDGYNEIGINIGEMIKQSLVEVPLIIDYDDDVSINSRLDQVYISQDGNIYCIDYKFVASLDGIEEKMFDYNYNVQAYIYSLQLYEKYKDEFALKDEFDIRNIYIVVEKAYPYRVRFITFSRETLTETKEKVQKTIELMKESHKTNDFIDSSKKFVRL